MKITLKQTCWACPEQYEAYDENGNYVAYLRLRHGFFTVECGGKNVYATTTQGDGIFDEDERVYHLNTACKRIMAHYAEEKVDELPIYEVEEMGDPDG